MYQIIVKNKFGSEWNPIFKTQEDLNKWVNENKPFFGKPARQAIKKGQLFAAEYDDADVLSQEEKQSSPSYERAQYSETETESKPYMTDVDGIQRFRDEPKYLGQETVPAKYTTMVNLKAEYEISEIIDLEKDPTFILQKKKEKARKRREVCIEILDTIQLVNDCKDKEAFKAFRVDYKSMISNLAGSELEDARTGWDLIKEKTKVSFSLEEVALIQKAFDNIVS